LLPRRGGEEDRDSAGFGGVDDEHALLNGDKTLFSLKREHPLQLFDRLISRHHFQASRHCCLYREPAPSNPLARTETVARGEPYLGRGFDCGVGDDGAVAKVFSVVGFLADHRPQGTQLVEVGIRLLDVFAVQVQRRLSHQRPAQIIQRIKALRPVACARV